MAQDIFHYFGRDKFGTIGCDTMLTTLNMDGIMMICLKALSKRTEKIIEMKQTISSLKAEYTAQENTLKGLRDKLNEMKKVLRNFQSGSKSFNKVKMTVK